MIRNRCNCACSYVSLVCVLWQTDKGDEELCSVYVPTNHLYIGDIFLVNSEEIIRPNLSIREGIGWFSYLAYVLSPTAILHDHVLFYWFLLCLISLCIEWMIKPS